MSPRRRTPPSRARRGVAAPLLLIALLALGAAATWLVLREDPRTTLTLKASVEETGVDADGYWFVRIRIENAGAGPWNSVDVGRPELVGAKPVPIEVGSTLPYGDVPQAFDLVLEAVEEDVRPGASGVEFALVIFGDPPLFSHRSTIATIPVSLTL